MPQHPDVLLANNWQKLDTWLADPTAEHPSIAIGAIGELVAAKALRATIVSDITDGHDLTAGPDKVEVRTAMEGREWPMKLGRKDANKVARVTLKRRSVNGGPDELWVQLVEIRDRGDNSKDNWSTVEGFKMERVDSSAGTGAA